MPSGITQARSMTQRRRRTSDLPILPVTIRRNQCCRMIHANAREQNGLHHHRTGDHTPPDTSELRVIPWLPERSCTNSLAVMIHCRCELANCDRTYQFRHHRGQIEVRFPVSFQRTTSRQYGSASGSDCTQESGNGAHKPDRLR